MSLKLSSNKTKKNNIITKSIDERLSLFYEYLKTDMEEHDKEHPTYQVKDYMLQDYIKENSLTEPWIKFLKSNRLLLYLDQFIYFYNKNINTLNEFISPEIKENYKLPILISIIALKKNNNSSAELYKKKLLDEIKKIMISFEKPRYIKDIHLMNTHGGMPYEPEILIVPDNVIIAFITPLNKFSYQRNTHDVLLKILSNLTNDNSFLNNPACYMRNDECFEYTNYYYPGQKIINHLFSYNTEKEYEKIYYGLYNSASEKINDFYYNINKDEWGFDKFITLKHIFEDEEKLNIIKNKILYIKCCRKCDLYLDNTKVEFFYRYEHMINYLNMSNCIAFDKYKSGYQCDYSKYQNDFIPLKNNIYNPNLFYNSSQSFKLRKFDSTKTKPDKYLYLSKNILESSNTNTLSTKSIAGKNNPTKEELNEMIINFIPLYEHSNEQKKRRIAKKIITLIIENSSNIKLEYVINVLENKFDFNDYINFTFEITKITKVNVDNFIEYLNNKIKDVPDIDKDLMNKIVFIYGVKAYDYFIDLYPSNKIKIDDIYNTYKEYFKSNQNTQNEISIHKKISDLALSYFGKSDMSKIFFEYLVCYITEYNASIKKSNNNSISSKYNYEIPKYIDYLLNTFIDKISWAINFNFSYDDYNNENYKKIKKFPWIIVKLISSSNNDIKIWTEIIKIFLDKRIKYNDDSNLNNLTANIKDLKDLKYFEIRNYITLPDIELIEDYDIYGENLCKLINRIPLNQCMYTDLKDTTNRELFYNKLVDYYYNDKLTHHDIFNIYYKFYGTYKTYLPLNNPVKINNINYKDDSHIERYINDNPYLFLMAILKKDYKIADTVHKIGIENNELEKNLDSLKNNNRFNKNKNKIKTYKTIYNVYEKYIIFIIYLLLKNIKHKDLTDEMTKKLVTYCKTCIVKIINAEHTSQIIYTILSILTACMYSQYKGSPQSFKEYLDENGIAYDKSLDPFQTYYSIEIDHLYKEIGMNYIYEINKDEKQLTKNLILMEIKP
jgi:hypothetical protein